MMCVCVCVCRFAFVLLEIEEIVCSVLWHANRLSQCIANAMQTTYFVPDSLGQARLAEEHVPIRYFNTQHIYIYIMI